MRANEIAALVERDILYPGDRVERITGDQAELRLDTRRGGMRARSAPWLIAQSDCVTDAVRIHLSGDLPGSDQAYGYVWLDDGRVVLLNEVAQFRELGRRLLRGLDPLAYAEILAELYSGRDISGPVVAPVFMPGAGQAGFFIRDARQFHAEHPYLPAGLVSSPDVQPYHTRAGHHLRMSFFAYELHMYELTTTISVYAWQLETVVGAPPAWTRTTVASMVPVVRQPKAVPSLSVEEVRAAFASVPEARVAVLGDPAAGAGVAMHVPAIGDTAHVAAKDLLRVQRMYAPDGSPALEFVVGGGPEALPLIITGTDLVFQPVPPDAVLDSRIPMRLSGMPPLVAYSEMMRDVEWFGRDPVARFNGQADGTLLQLRCFIMGAARLGMRPLAAVHWWQRAWELAEDEVGLPPWRDDPLWLDLVAEARLASTRDLLTRSWLQPQVDERGAVARLSVDDFLRLEPALTVIGLDDELLGAWRGWVPVTPATFAATLLRGVPDGSAEVSFYPDGGGSVDIRVAMPSGKFAFMQFRFSFPDGDLAIDEIRIPSGEGGGLFRRLMFNTEALAAQLGMKQVSLHATDVGALAFATLGVYPRDYELRRTGAND
ncbi:hypothetical protein QEZ54_11775 [Catellatospora sp. KI3]|uniref:hypothetical protein n=1 Tax=Catellatospora sp. KI3 TaxID=3041620 RepID=UPI0024826ED0|nr:hypothetical protein [Catellatospora sp. KI3]MDI1461653.1 hypothetical protein [Catellatospora sp. KI3]